MNIDTNTIFSMTEANQNFSMVARTVDQYGTAIIFKNNKPRYEIRVFDDTETDETASDEDVLDISKKLLKRCTSFPIFSTYSITSEGQEISKSYTVTFVDI